MSIGYRDEGTLIVALDRDDAAALRFTFDLQKRFGLDVEWLSGRAARRREPFLSPTVTAAVLSLGDHQVDNRLVVEALKTAFLKAGGRLHENTAVEGIDRSEEHTSELQSLMRISYAVFCLQ